jgi:hypothetical protein
MTSRRIKSPQSEVGCKPHPGLPGHPLHFTPPLGKPFRLPTRAFPLDVAVPTLTQMRHSCILDTKNFTSKSDHKIRNLGYCWPRAFCIPCANVLPQCTGRLSGLRSYQTYLPYQSQALGCRATTSSLSRNCDCSRWKQIRFMCRKQQR